MNTGREKTVHEKCTGHTLSPDSSPEGRDRRRQSDIDQCMGLRCSPSNDTCINLLRGAIEQPPHDSEDERHSDWAVSELDRCMKIRKDRSKGKENANTKRKPGAPPEAPPAKRPPAKRQTAKRPPFPEQAGGVPLKPIPIVDDKQLIVAKKQEVEPVSRENTVPALTKKREPDNLFNEGKAFVCLQSAVKMSKNSTHASMICKAPEREGPTLKETLEARAAAGTKDLPKKKKETKKDPTPRFPSGGKKKFEEIMAHMKEQLIKRLKGRNKSAHNKIDVVVWKENIDECLDIIDKQAEMTGCVNRSGLINIAHALGD